MGSKKLKSLWELKAFDGEKHKAEIHRDKPLPKCKHKDVYIMGGNKLRCKCGNSWEGQNIIELYKKLKKG